MSKKGTPGFLPLLQLLEEKRLVHLDQEQIHSRNEIIQKTGMRRELAENWKRSQQNIEDWRKTPEEWRQGRKEGRVIYA